MAIELHNQEDQRIKNIQNILSEKNIDSIYASSNVRLSKYHSSQPESRMNIFVVDQYDRWDKPSPIDQATEIFQKYEGARVIDRFYVAPEDYDRVKKILQDTRF